MGEVSKYTRMKSILNYMVNHIEEYLPTESHFRYSIKTSLINATDSLPEEKLYAEDSNFDDASFYLDEAIKKCSLENEKLERFHNSRSLEVLKLQLKLVKLMETLYYCYFNQINRQINIMEDLL